MPSSFGSPPILSLHSIQEGFLKTQIWSCHFLAWNSGMILHCPEDRVNAMWQSKNYSLSLTPFSPFFLLTEPWFCEGQQLCSAKELCVPAHLVARNRCMAKFWPVKWEPKFQVWHPERFHQKRTNSGGLEALALFFFFLLPSPWLGKIVARAAVATWRP